MGTIIMLIFMVLLIIAFLVGMIELWKPHKPVTDEEMYGMSANAYALMKMGEDSFIQHYTYDEYIAAKNELDALKNKSDGKRI